MLHEISKELLQAEIERVLRKIDFNLDRWTDRFPDPASENMKYEDIDNVEWTTSFWTGMLWLAYEYTKDEKYRRVAKKHTDSFRHRLEAEIALDHHDIGFLYTLSCVADYKLTGSREAGDIAVKAADRLCSRYHDQAGILQAWGDLNDPQEQGRMIIDCLMNLPLLYFAAGETGDKTYYEIALGHAEKAAQYLVREDNTTYHTYYFDVQSGAPRYGRTHQGAYDDSCWARGQAWGVYGFLLSYRYTGNVQFLDTACRLADYFIDSLPEDGICYWDLVFRDGAYEPRDSSAMVITACGLLELLKELPYCESQRRCRYEAFISRTFHTLRRHYVSDDLKEDGILLHGTYGKNPNHRGVDQFCIWGDYYYLEMLTRLISVWTPYW